MPPPLLQQLFPKPDLSKISYAMPQDKAAAVAAVLAAANRQVGREDFGTKHSSSSSSSSRRSNGTIVHSNDKNQVMSPRLEK
mmetsp:Transcript_23906/g.40475  ORF Transcript_23906/g.40475 Transcript_23906/m.40475 type:complete len:82 (+) Transcript_23906:412-657(+)